MVWRKRKQQTVDSIVVANSGAVVRDASEMVPGGQPRGGLGSQVSAPLVGDTPQNVDPVSQTSDRYRRDFSMPVHMRASQRPYVVPRNYRISGAISSERQVLVEGEFVEGILQAPTVTVAAGGVVRGRIEATNLQVAGTVNATVAVRVSVEVSDKGRLSGDVQAPSMKVWPGAVLDASRLSVGGRAA